ncbi:LacI family DNA-binding transcriptional regulator [Agromyces kandeliae]|uniref:LacI family DNA-binding transcriptional regulator n=1 Tax=Agromyces kandeliae TaxID=2666141 RepID=A0A6L5R4A3_9MICO|nr:LacI family DNA-binding transcriptional regulator [Agromyces kandeliae]MRX44812.1 LacI family DNA-binding transcriptional regulator [Agromyces kandeliae]
MAVTMKDVAERAGTSTAVVSYVFNDGPRGVSDRARQRVLDAAAELGYRPNRIARALRAARSGFIGVISPDSSNPYFAQLDRAVIAAIGARGSTALISHPGPAGMTDEQALRSLIGAQVDGLVMVAWEARPLRADLSQSATPIVFTHHRPDGAQGVFVAADDEHAVGLAFEHLRDDHGHEDIGFWTGPDDVGPVGRRLAAWRALRDGVGEPHRSGYTRGEARDALLQADDRSLERAIIVATDEQAIGLLAAAHLRGIRVPDELAVISLDGTSGTDCTVPSLSVVHQPIDQMAERAVSALMDGTEDELETRGALIARESCGCVTPDGASERRPRGPAG